MISIIITNHNGENNLRRNLPKVVESAKKYSKNPVEIIVVDDASSDQSVKFLEEFSRQNEVKFRFIVNKVNLGFAESSNIGVQNANGEFVVLLNSDVYPEQNFLEFLIPHFDDKQVFAVGCLEKTVGISGEVESERGVGKLFFKNGIYQHSSGDLNSKETDWVCGGSGAFRRDVFLKLKGFDLRFKPFYWEDIDLSFRAKKSGYKLLFEKQSIVFHQHIAGSIATSFTKKQIEEISFANQLKFTIAHISSPGQMFGFLWFMLKRFIKKTYA